MTTDRFNLAGSVLESRFRVDRAVAEGGFGVVYFGQHLALEKPVAIKVLKIDDELSRKAREQVLNSFAMEAKLIAKLTHPNIVQALDYGVSEMPSNDRAPWLVLEWIEGGTLKEWVQQQPSSQFMPDAALNLLRPIFEALAFAHEQGVAHRDIKPSNIMVVEHRNGRRMLRLMDFGIAKVMEEGEKAGTGLTRTGGAGAFSPRYGAYEQASGTRTGPWTDVHALGLIMTELLIGRPAYKAHDRVGLMGEILSDERPTPGRHGVDVGPWEPILARALARSPGERYPDAGEFLAALENALPSVRANAPARPVDDSATVRDAESAWQAQNPAAANSKLSGGTAPAAASIHALPTPVYRAAPAVDPVQATSPAIVVGSGTQPTAPFALQSAALPNPVEPAPAQPVAAVPAPAGGIRPVVLVSAIVAALGLGAVGAVAFVRMNTSSRTAATTNLSPTERPVEAKPPVAPAIAVAPSTAQDASVNSTQPPAVSSAASPSTTTEPPRPPSQTRPTHAPTSRGGHSTPRSSTGGTPHVD